MVPCVTPAVCYVMNSLESTQQSVRCSSSLCRLGPGVKQSHKKTPCFLCTVLATCKEAYLPSPCFFFVTSTLVCFGTDVGKKAKKKGRKAMDEAMHVVKQSMSDTGGLGYFHVCSSSSYCPLCVCLCFCVFIDSSNL